MEKEFEFKREGTYRLIAVLDKEGKDKVNSRRLYQDRIGCICTDIRRLIFDGESVLKMRFLENAEGQYCNMTLETSALEKLEPIDDVIKVFTRNSIYVFEEATLAVHINKEERNLIELYFSSESDHMFAKGFLYDESGTVWELKNGANIGTFQDSVLVYKTEIGHNDIVCRYFPQDDNRHAEFYNNVFTEEPYSTPMLIHNVGKQDLEVAFEMYQNTWIIDPGESKRIIPYLPDGFNENEEEI